MSTAIRPEPFVASGLAVEGLSVAYDSHGTQLPVVRDLSFNVSRGEAFGIVGESGSGKSSAAFAIIRRLPRNGAIIAGSVRVAGTDILRLNSSGLRSVWASQISMVYQDPARALNPSMTVGTQIIEVFRILGVNRAEATSRAQDALASVRIPSPASVLRRFPHELSGGMQQRVVIAMALAPDPAVLILDEPTTGLDATVEAEVLDLVAAQQAAHGTALVYISHNLGVISRMCDRVGVMYAGELVEEGPARDLLTDPRHPYTAGLLRALPRRDLHKTNGRLHAIPGTPPDPGTQPPGCIFAPRCELASEVCSQVAPDVTEFGHGRRSKCHFSDRVPELQHRQATADALPAAPPVATTPRELLVRLRGVGKTYAAGKSATRALVSVDLGIYAGETLGLVGESGSGKSTLARVIAGLVAPDPGASVTLDEVELGGDVRHRSTTQKRAIQMVFQNPDSALNRRHTVQRIAGHPMSRLSGMSRRDMSARIRELIHSVQLSDRHLGVKPSELSGGLKQRVAIARAFAGRPRIVVCDEPTSALDVSVQAAVLNLLSELQKDRGVSYLLISHDLGVVRFLADRIAVMYLGSLMEVGAVEAVFSGPHHPYTEVLLSAVPAVGGGSAQRIALQGEIPSPSERPAGCVFHTRCHRRIGPVCDEVDPPVVELEPGHEVRCHLPADQLHHIRGDSARKE